MNEWVLVEYSISSTLLLAREHEQIAHDNSQDRWNLNAEELAS